MTASHWLIPDGWSTCRCGAFLHPVTSRCDSCGQVYGQEEATTGPDNNEIYEDMTMSGDTKIPYATKTWNPVEGCAPCSPGCEHCWARKLVKRFASMPMPHNRYACIQDWDGTVAEFPERWAEPLHWRAPQRVFVGSRSDIALWSDVQWVNLMSIMRATPRHRYLLLTKRPRAVGMWVECCGPLPLNVWAGVTVCNQNEAEEKIPELLRIPAAGYWLSIEPMLSAVSIVEEHVCQDENCGHARLGWVVAGGESGPGDRRMEVAWVRDLRYQCLKSGTPFYFKQWSDANPGSRFEPSGMPVLDGVVDAAIPHALLVPAKEHGVMR